MVLNFNYTSRPASLPHPMGKSRARNSENLKNDKIVVLTWKPTFACLLDDTRAEQQGAHKMLIIWAVVTHFDAGGGGDVVGRKMLRFSDFLFWRWFYTIASDINKCEQFYDTEGG